MILMALVGTADREVVVAELRRHYLAGRLSWEELDRRLQAAFVARSDRDLRRALRELSPLWRNRDEVRRVGRLALRVAVRASLFASWLLFSLVLLIVFVALTALAQGLAGSEALAFPLVWLLATVLVWRAARRA